MCLLLIEVWYRRNLLRHSSGSNPGGPRNRYYERNSASRKISTAYTPEPNHKPLIWFNTYLYILLPKWEISKDVSRAQTPYLRLFLRSGKYYTLTNGTPPQNLPTRPMNPNRKIFWLSPFHLHPHFKIFTSWLIFLMVWNQGKCSFNGMVLIHISFHICCTGCDE